MEMMEAPAEEEKERVCVTGAGGFVGSWIVKLLLSSDYLVHGTVRKPPGDSKYAHLSKLEKASENLKLFKADLLDYNSLCSAVAGCSGVFHVASPVIPSASVTNPQKWYLLSKTLAEREALEFGKRTGLEIITVLPSLNLGPILQPTMNASSWFLAKVLKGGFESIGYNYWTVVAVRDVAEAVLLVYKKSEVGERYICTAYAIGIKDLVDNYLRVAYPNYNYPHDLSHTEEEEKSVSSDRLQRLGWSYRPLKETLIDSIESYRKASVLD